MDRITVEIGRPNSNSVKSSTERKLRFEPWICWLNKPRKLVVSRAETPFLRPDIRAEVKLPGGVAIYVAIKARHPKAGLRALVIGQVEFFL